MFTIQTRRRAPKASFDATTKLVIDLLIKEKVKVLYVESYPRYEFRFLKNLLEREETVDMAATLAQLQELAEEEARIDERLESYFAELGLVGEML